MEINKETFLKENFYRVIGYKMAKETEIDEYLTDGIFDAYKFNKILEWYLL